MVAWVTESNQRRTPTRQVITDGGKAEMATLDELLQNVKGALVASQERLSVTREEGNTYLELLSKQAVLTTMLTDGLDKLDNLSTKKRLTIWSVGIVASAVGILAVLWASRMKPDAAHDLLEIIGGALITFGLVEVCIHWVVEIPIKRAREQARLVSEVKSANESAIEIIIKLKADAVAREPELDRLDAKLDAMIQGLAP